MINIIHNRTHCDDKRRISALEIKVKSFKDEGSDKILTGHSLVATVSCAFLKTTILTDEGKSYETRVNSRRQNIVDLSISFKHDTKLTFKDISNFLEAFQKTLDETEKELIF